MPAPPPAGHPERPSGVDSARPVHRRLPLVLVVAAGGAVGAPLRYALARALPAAPDGWPTATFVTNLLGAFLLGVLLEGLARSGPDAGTRRVVRLGVGTGVLGAFTTYSTLATEAVLLGRDRHPGLAVGYGLTSALAGYTAAAAGIGLASVGRRAGRARTADTDARTGR